MIFFNEPLISSVDESNIKKVLDSKNLADGYFQKKAAELLRKKISSNYLELTQSGSNALEVASLLLQIKAGDEVIMPSFTFSATANSIVLFGGKPVFADVNDSDLCIDLDKVEKLITKRTKAIYLVHYGGNSCDMKKAAFLKRKYNLYIIEDSAHSLFSMYKNKFCGTIGDIGIFSFHQTKNFVTGHGGAISINRKNLQNRATIILDKGNQRRSKTKFGFYKWIDVGSEYRAPEIPAALLYGQLKRSKFIQKKKKEIFNFYRTFLISHKNFHKSCNFLDVNDFSSHSYHIVGIIFISLNLAEKFKEFMKLKKIQVANHYYPLHLSPYGKKFKFAKCPVTEKIYNRLIRLPSHLNLNNEKLLNIKNNINHFFDSI